MASAIKNIYYIPRIISNAEYHRQHSPHHHIASLFADDVDTNNRQSVLRTLLILFD